MLNGKISITRSSNDTISIELKDESSAITFLRAEMTPEAFGFAITGLGMQQCEFRYLQDDRIGKKLEVKTEIVPCPYMSPSNFVECIRDYVQPYEVDGWKAKSSLTNYNPHNRTSEGYRVTFKRYVEEDI
jgi:hypothetical protein